MEQTTHTGITAGLPPIIAQEVLRAQSVIGPIMNVARQGKDAKCSIGNMRSAVRANPISQDLKISQSLGRLERRVPRSL